MLSDSSKRRQFDASGGFGSGTGPTADGFYRSANRNSGGRQSGWAYSSTVDPEELFRTVFGNFGSSRARGNSIFDTILNQMYNEPKHLSLNIDFLDAVRGISKSFNVDVTGQCSSCQGTGSVSTGHYCSGCNGSGQVIRRFGNMQMYTPCSQCAGTGVKASRCYTCYGQGYVNKKQPLNITVSTPSGEQS